VDLLEALAVETHETGLRHTLAIVAVTSGLVLALSTITFWWLEAIVTASAGPVPPLVVETTAALARLAPDDADAWFDEAAAAYAPIITSTGVLTLRARPRLSLEREVPAPPGPCTSPLTQAASTRSCRLGHAWWVAGDTGDGRWLVARFDAEPEVPLMVTSWPMLWAATALPLLALAVPIGLGVSHLVRRRQRRRLARILDAAAAWTPGRPWAPLGDGARDVLGRVAQTLDALGARVEQGLEAEALVAVAAERRRFAEDLHDRVKQSVFAANLLLGVLVRRLGATAPEADRAQHALRTALADIEALLEPPATPSELTDEAVADVGAQVERLWDTPVARSGPAFRLTAPSAEVTAVLREALTNAMKHAGGRGLVLTWALEPAELVLEVADAGGGFETSQAGGGLGLETMRERARRMGATLRVERRGEGTCVRLSLPRRAP
jgi:signal transduction histidine kinase